MHFLADLVMNALQRDVVFSVLLHFHELLQINSILGARTDLLEADGLDMGHEHLFDGNR